MPEAQAGALVAGLPMYDWPEVRWATDALWTALAERLRADGIEAPSTLDRTLGLEALWRHPRLLLGQTCGWPYVRSLRDTVRLIGTPGYTADGCEGTDYCSVVVVRSDERAAALVGMEGRLAAVNDPMSLSGGLALRVALADAGPAAGLAGMRLSGSHRRSLQMVAAGAADLCAVDAICWALALRHEPETTARLRVLAQTPPAPGLPVICATGMDTAALRAALTAVLVDPALADVRELLLLSGALATDEAAYDRVEDLESAARGVTLQPVNSIKSHLLP